MERHNKQGYIKVGQVKQQLSTIMSFKITVISTDEKSNDCQTGNVYVDTFMISKIS